MVGNWSFGPLRGTGLRGSYIVSLYLFGSRQEVVSSTIGARHGLLVNIMVKGHGPSMESESAWSIGAFKLRNNLTSRCIEFELLLSHANGLYAYTWRSQYLDLIQPFLKSFRNSYTKFTAVVP
jgi:hypothetical protein